jgi:hypothetical protein
MKKTTTSFAKTKKIWNQQPFLEKLLFLMNQFKISEDEAEVLAKKKFDKIAIAYKYQIYLFLN